MVRGVLPQVLDELLSTRAMLKKASKEYKKRVPDLAPSILRQLEARQVALKYVANVTYGELMKIMFRAVWYTRFVLTQSLEKMPWQ